MELLNTCNMNEFYQELIQQLPDIIYKINNKGEFIYLNDSVTRLGYSPEELIGRHFSTLFYEEDLPLIQHKTAVEKIKKEKKNNACPLLFDERRTGKRITKKLRVKLASKNGNGRNADFMHGEIFCSGLYDHDITEHRAYVGTVGIIRDITELSRTEKALTLAERHYRFLIENTSDVISILAIDGTILYKSPSAERNLGYNHFDLIGENEIDYIHPDDKPFLEAFLTNPGFYNSGKAYFELRYRQKDKTWKYFELSITRVFDAGNTIMCYVAYSRDISERHEKEREIQEKEKKYRALFDMSSDAIFVISENYTILECNNSALLSFGYEREDVINKNLETLGLFEDNDSIQICISGLNKSISLPEITCRRKDGFTFPSLLTAFPVEKSESGIVILNIRDLSTQKMIEDETFKSKKIESLELLAEGIANNFNEILTPINTNISIAKNSIEKKNPIYQLLSEAETAASRAGELTNQLLLFSKGYTPETKNTSLKKLIKEVAEPVLKGSKIQATYSIARNLREVDIDEAQVVRVFENIVANARQSMPRGGNLHITAINTAVSEKNKENLEPGDYVKISFMDEGCGIDSEDLDKIFDPYFTLKEDGNGLGLTLSQAIIQKHNGQIIVDSEVRRGTIFTIFLPANHTNNGHKKKSTRN
ncbi:MAG TPA: PAS domain S-box protein [Spirochaetota bacterium]|nr:PAS domain S-box protein [Spirochaetota bacterium]HPI89506.1 PAS domain S-box protein [Spirochaetota bacterium]HPR47094.1 PAS domain S-box protein [Spirochaetota bacterium]